MIKKKLTIMLIVFGLFAGVFISVYYDFESILKHIFSFNSIVILLAIPFSYFLVINIHELGHLFLGKLVGYKMLKYKFRSFTWKNENGKCKFMIEKPSGYDGLCLMIPPKEGVSKHASLVYYFGGIITNILTAIIIIIFLHINPELHLYIKQFLFVLMALSILLNIFNLVPFTSMNNPNDGLIIWELIKGSSLSLKIININRLMKYIVAGVRPKDIIDLNRNVNYIDEVDSLDIYELIYMLYNAIDKDDHLKMQKCIDILEKNRKKIPTAIEFGIDYELCYCYSILGNIEKAKYCYEKVMSKIEKENDANVNRIKAYYEFIVNKNTGKSMEYCQKGLSLIDVYPLRGIALMEKDLLKKLEQLKKNENNNFE